MSDASRSKKKHKKMTLIGSYDINFGIRGAEKSYKHPLQEIEQNTITNLRSALDT